jgi:hypothetical protein
MIPTYNCARYLADTLKSVLEQDPGPAAMQIEVIDDASTDDDPAEVVARIGGGRVAFHRQDRNVGQVENFATCLNRSRGQLVHLLHGDDCVRPGFYAALGRAFAADPQIGAAFCRWALIDDAGVTIEEAAAEQPQAGRLSDALARLAAEQRITTPSIAVRRPVWEALGGFDSRLQCAEDWEMWVRIAARYPIWYEPTLLASYRVRPASTTARHLRMAEELHYTARAIELFGPLLPQARRGFIKRAARSAYAASALRNASRYARRGDRAAVNANLKAALMFSTRPKVLARAALIRLRLLWFCA